MIASLIFYAISGLQGIAYIVLTSFSTWLLAKKIQNIQQEYKENVKTFVGSREQKKQLKLAVQARKKRILFATLILNFGVLALLKVSKYLIVVPETSVLHGLLTKSSGGLLIPLGISFYTFQAMSYIIDIYNAKYAAETSYLKFLLYLSFFPQLIQGPINRYDHMQRQLVGVHLAKNTQFRRALILILFGIMKKYVIANSLTGLIAELFDTVNPEIPGSAVVLGILLYSIQQYGDFSGGIDMVMGIAELFGISMDVNFKQPYFSTSLANFWQRWHISLGTWMRDYVFYPIALTKSMQKLGKCCDKHFGKHLGRVVPACIANIIVFLIVGIWHGVEEHYVAWGLYNGVVIALSSLFEPWFTAVEKRISISISSKQGLRIVRTFLIVNIGWYFDRINDFTYRMICFRNTFMRFRMDLLKPTLYSFGLNAVNKPLMIAAVGTILLLIWDIRAEQGHDVREELLAKPVLFRTALYVVVSMLILWSFVFVEPTDGFMYANF